MKRVLKLLGKILLGLLAIPVVFYVFLVLYNLRDDALDPQVEKIMAAAPPQIPAAENGYFAWVGVVGPADQDPHAWGQRWVREALEADKKAAADLNASTTLSIDAEKRKDGLSNKGIACGEKIETCLETVAAQPDAARAVLEKGQVALARGDAALAYPAYQEVWRPEFSYTSPIPGYANFYRQLSATRFALAVAEGRHDQALEQLGSEMPFHARQMAGAVTLIEKMVAVASLRNDYLLLNQYLARHPAEAKQRAESLAALLAPLSADALRFQGIWLNEQRSGLRTIFSLKDMDGTALFGVAGADDGAGTWFLSHFGKPLLLVNATANEFSRHHDGLLAADALSGAAYRDALARTKHDLEAATQDTYVLRNPIGHILNAIAIPSYDSYYLKRDDLVALREALAFQLAQSRSGADGEAIAQALPAAAALVHPYDGVAPAWDKAKRTLTYAALPARNGKPIVLNF